MTAGCIPIAGYNVGAGRNDRVIEVMKRLMAAEVLVGLAATAVFLLFPRPLIQLFGAGKESVYYTQFAVWFIRAQLCLLPLFMPVADTLTFIAVAFVLFKTKKELETTKQQDNSSFNEWIKIAEKVRQFGSIFLDCRIF